jgi:hypothetical protein
MTAKKSAKRGRHPLPDDERKDRLVQTRVPEVLDETLREAARKNRVSVSQLIRNVLENTFDLVDNVVTHTTGMTTELKRDARRIAESARGHAPAKAKPERGPSARPISERGPSARPITERGSSAKPISERGPSARISERGNAKDQIYAWQDVIINRDASCSRCTRQLVKGERGSIGLQDDATADKVWLCAACAALL